MQKTRTISELKEFFDRHKNEFIRHDKIAIQVYQNCVTANAHTVNIEYDNKIYQLRFDCHRYGDLGIYLQNESGTGIQHRPTKQYKMFEDITVLYEILPENIVKAFDDNKEFTAISETTETIVKPFEETKND